MRSQLLLPACVQVEQLQAVLQLGFKNFRKFSHSGFGLKPTGKFSRKFSKNFLPSKRKGKQRFSVILRLGCILGCRKFSSLTPKFHRNPMISMKISWISTEFSQFVGFTFSQILILRNPIQIHWNFMIFHENPLEIHQKSLNFLQKS